MSLISTKNDEEHTRECVKELYDSQVGVRETGGSNRGSHVEMYLASVDLGPSYAWCAAFVSWCYQNAEVEAPQSAWVPSFALRRKRIYHRGKFEKQTPQKGDVFMIWYNSKNRPAHIGFIDQWGEKWIVTVEGNTNDNGSREGDGVYRKRRLKKQVWVVSDFVNSTDRQKLP
ncbi:CHAP domain-containing protein [Aquimarina sp. MMG016]|uniref:CHAP domain-containing protein n=1 Tax=Aquimarina sp. MMG016 TaxID=2822690 RepID=UPI001FFCAB6E|nr:CHAP domain-containing protein [Aquimarina sp. MMG016]